MEKPTRTAFLELRTPEHLQALLQAQKHQLVHQVARALQPKHLVVHQVARALQQKHPQVHQQARVLRQAPVLRHEHQLVQLLRPVPQHLSVNNVFFLNQCNACRIN